MSRRVHLGNAGLRPLQPMRAKPVTGVAAPKLLWCSWCTRCGQPLLADSKKGGVARTPCPLCPTLVRPKAKIGVARYALVTKAKGKD
jgi:hypothetical protein